MKLINRLMLALLCLFFSAQQAHPKIQDIRTMAGWHDCFKDENKHLSPFNGFVWWETKFIEKMFRFGYVQTQTKKRSNGGTWTEAISGDATIRLLYELFQDIEGTLHLVQEPTHFAYYLTPELIGKILHLLQDPTPTIPGSKKFAGLLKTIPGKTLTDQLKALQNNQKYQNQSQTLYTNLLQDLFKINLESELDRSVGKSTKREIIKSANKFADLLTKALLESHDLPSIEEQKFLAHTPGYILLSFMYAKVDNIDQFKSYIDQLSLEAIKENAEEILNTKKFDNSWTAEQFDKSDKQFIQEHYEEICFTCINDQFYKLQTPQFKENRFSVNINDFGFISCSEEAMYNFILLILSKIGLYSPATKTFELDKLEEKMTSWLTLKHHSYNAIKLNDKLSQLRILLEKFNDPLLIHSNQSLQAWAEFVSDRDRIKYSRCVATDGSGKELEARINETPFMYSQANQHIDNSGSYRPKVRNESFKLCELTGYPSTYVNLINDLLGLNCPDFEKICQLFDLTIKNYSELENFSDEFVRELYLDDAPALTLFLDTTINNQPVAIKMLSSIAHSIVINQQISNKEIERYSYRSPNIASYVCQEFSRDDQTAHLVMLYSLYPIVNSKDFHESLPLWLHHHFWFCLDLFTEGKHLGGLTKLAQASKSTFLDKLAQQQFREIIQNKPSEAISFITRIACENLQLDEWMLDLCKSLKENKTYDEHLWIDLLNYLLRFHSQFDSGSDIRNEIIEYIRCFAEKETNLDSKIRLLLINFLTNANLSDTDLYNLLTELVNHLFNGINPDYVVYSIAFELIYQLNDESTRCLQLLKKILDQQLKSLFHQELPENYDQQNSILNLEIKILNFAVSMLSIVCSDENINILKRLIALGLKRMAKLLESNDARLIKRGISVLYDACSKLHQKKDEILIQEIFNEEYLPLINRLDENRDFIIQMIGKDSFKAYIGWLLHYKNEILIASFAQWSTMPPPPPPPTPTP